MVCFVSLILSKRERIAICLLPHVAGNATFVITMDIVPSSLSLADITMQGD